MCGADFPLKVSELGEANAVAMSYGDEIRPPAAIPGWRHAALAGPRTALCAGAERAGAAGANGAVAIPASAGATGARRDPSLGAGSAGHRAPARCGCAGRTAAVDLCARCWRRKPTTFLMTPCCRKAARAPRTQPAYYAPPQVQPAPRSRAVPPLGPMRGPAATTAMTMPAALKPPATLACPIVSALDRWVARRRAAGGAALVRLAGRHHQADRLLFVPRNGRRRRRLHVRARLRRRARRRRLHARRRPQITVKDGWHGTPEEQGFLHDVQLSPARLSRRCWRPATTSITTTTSTWT